MTILVAAAVLSSVFAVVDILNPAVAVAAPPTTYDGWILQDAPVSYWRLDEPQPVSGVATVLDAIGSHNGTSDGSTSLGQPGLVNGGYSSGPDAGTSAKFLNPDWSPWGGRFVVPLTGAGDGTLRPNRFTLEGWVKGGVNEYVALSGGYSLEAKLSNGQSTVEATVATPGGVVTVSAPLSQAGVAHHIVATYDGATLRVYVDGRMVGSAGASGNVAYGTGTELTLGNNSDPQGQGAGSLDAVAIYDYALPPGQVATHYHASVLSKVAATFGASAHHVGYSNDPINTSTGNFTHIKNVVEYPSFIYGMDFPLTYNSLDPSNSVAVNIGAGWTSSFDSSILELGDGSLLWQGLDGRQVGAKSTGVNTWSAPDGFVGQIRKDVGASPAHTYVLQLADGERYEYDAAGRLAQRCQGVGDWATRSDWLAGGGWLSSADWCGTANTGQFVTIQRMSQTDPRVSSVVSSTGMTQALSFDGANRLSSVRAHDDATTADDRLVSFGYGSSGLSSASTPHFSSELGTAYPVEVYSITTQRLSTVAVTSALPDGSPDLASQVASVVNVYDPTTGRVTQQTTATGDVVTFGWDDVNRSLTVTNGASGDHVTYRHDADDRLLSTTDPYDKIVASIWSQGADGSGSPLQQSVPTQDPTEVTDRTGAAAGYFYDSIGRLVQTMRPDASSGFGPHTYSDASPTSCQRLPDGSFPTPNTTTSFTRPGGQSASMNCAGQRFAIESYTYVNGSDARVDTYTNEIGAKTHYTYAGSSPIPASVTAGYQSSDANVPAVTTSIESSNDRINASSTGGAVTCYFYNSFSQVTDEGLLLVAVGQGQTVTQACAAHLNDGNLAKTHYTYTALGKTATEAKPAPQGTWTYTYYGTGQLKTVADPIVGHLPVIYTYLPTGEIATVSDELGKVTTTTIAHNVMNQTTCNGGAASDPDGHAVVMPCKTITTQPPAPAGPTTTIYDASGDLRVTVAAGSARTWRVYGRLSRLTKAIDPTGVATTYVYDDDGRVTTTQAGTESGSAGVDAQATTAYDARGRVLTQVTAKNDATKVITAYAYDAADREIQQVMAAPDGTIPGRQADGTFPAPTSAGQNWTMRTTSYGPTGAVEQTALYRNDVPAGPGSQATVLHKYDNGGREICVDTRVTAAGGGDVETHTYQANDYDSVSGRRTKSRTPLQPDAATGKSPPTGCADSPTDSDKWAIAATAYNTDGSPLWEQSPVQYKAHPVVDNNHVKYRTTFGYDGAGRQVTLQSPNPVNPGGGTVTDRTCYTPRGETAVTVDAANNVTAYTYFDESNTVASVTDSTGMTYNSSDPCASTAKTGANTHRGVTTFGYDGRGNRTSRQTWADNLASQLASEIWTFDAADRPTGYSSGGSSPVQWSVGYNISNGRLTGKTTTTGSAVDSSLRRTVETEAPSGAAVNVESDVCGLSCASIPNDADHRTIVSVAYDPLGRRAGVIDNSPGRSAMGYGFGYDTAGNITTQIYPDGKTNTVSWNLTGQAVKQTYPDAASFRYRYDPRLALQEVDVLSVGVWIPVATETTDPNGARTKETLTSSNSGSRTWTRNGATDTLDKYTQILTGTTAITTAVNYDKAGRVSSECAATGSGGACQSTDVKRAYSYDDASQLTTATVTNDSTTGDITKWAYTYGNHGNRLTQKITANGSGTTTTNYSWNQATMEMCTATVGSNTPSCANPTGATTAYSYDGAGRRTAATSPTGTSETYGYDGRGIQNLTTSTPSGGATTTTRSVIDPLGQLLCNDVAQCWSTEAVPHLTGPTTSNGWLYWDNSDATGSVAQVLQFMFFSGDIRWVYTAGRLSQNGSYFSNDYLGSVMSLAGGAGPSSYSPFGEQIGGTAFNGYHGELQSSTINLRARYYDPKTGTFTTRDPLDGVNGTADVANPYTYTHNSPLNGTDPTGKRCTDVSCLTPTRPSVSRQFALGGYDDCSAKAPEIDAAYSSNADLQVVTRDHYDWDMRQYVNRSDSAVDWMRGCINQTLRRMQLQIDVARNQHENADFAAGQPHNAKEILDALYGHRGAIADIVAGGVCVAGAIETFGSSCLPFVAIAGTINVEQVVQDDLEARASTSTILADAGIALLKSAVLAIPATAEYFEMTSALEAADFLATYRISQVGFEAPVWFRLGTSLFQEGAFSSPAIVELYRVLFEGHP